VFVGQGIPVKDAFKPATIASRSRLPIRRTVRPSREACRLLCRSEKGTGLRAGVERGIMIRWIPAAAIVAIVLARPAAYARLHEGPRSGRSSFPAGSIEGRVLDNSNRPVVGAMVSVVGRTTAAAATDRDGRYSLRELPYGPYILSVHSRGFFKSRGRTVQLTTSTVSIPEIQLQTAHPEKARRFDRTVADASAVQVTQLAGFGLAASQLEPRMSRDTPAPSSPQITDEETSEEGRPRGVSVTCRAVSSKMPRRTRCGPRPRG
jgi:hypothetical protein